MVYSPATRVLAALELLQARADHGAELAGGWRSAARAPLVRCCKT